MWRRTSKPATEESEELRRARAEAARAQQQFEAARTTGEYVDLLHTAVVAALRRNHFGESIEAAFRRRRTT